MWSYTLAYYITDLRPLESSVGLGLTILFPPLALSLYLYLASLAISDTFVLLFYVLVEWLHRGMGRWPAGRPLNLAALHPGTTSLHMTLHCVSKHDPPASVVRLRF